MLSSSPIPWPPSEGRTTHHESHRLWITPWGLPGGRERSSQVVSRRCNPVRIRLRMRGKRGRKAMATRPPVMVGWAW